MILMRATSGWRKALGTSWYSTQSPSMRKRIRQGNSRPCGSMWMSLVPRRKASMMIWFTSLIIVLSDSPTDAPSSAASSARPVPSEVERSRMIEPTSPLSTPKLASMQATISSRKPTWKATCRSL